MDLIINILGNLDSFNQYSVASSQKTIAPDANHLRNVNVFRRYAPEIASP